MPRIDPNQLLRCLSVLLSQNGGIKSKDEVARIVSLMTKFSKKLVSKCIYVLILKTTEADLLDMFMSAGGWDLTNNWLNDSIQIENWPLVLEIVELLLLCPVDLERLKGNNCPKAIKMLSKDIKAPEKVRLLASNVVEQWLAVVKSSCEATTSQAESPQGAHSEEEMEEEDCEEEPEKKIQAPYKIKIVEGKTVLAEIINDQVASSTAEDVEMKEIDSEKTKTSETKRSSRKRGDKRSSTDNEEKDKKKMSSEKRLKLDLKAKMKEKERQWAKEKEKEREKEREKQHKERAKQEEKDKAVLSKLMTPTLTHVGKIPKKSKEDKKDQKTDEKPKKSEPVKPPPQPKDPKKYNISVEIRKGEERPKTVKTFNSKFRSTGLEELPPPPKSVKKTDVKKSEDEKKPAKVPKEEKKPKEEEKEKTEKAPPKPKVLQESDVFADALTAANPVRDVKKRKRRPSNSTSETSKKESASSPVQTKTDKPEDQKPVFKFYQDTLITSEDKVKEETKEDVKLEKLDESIEEEAEADFPQFSKAEIEDEVAKAEEAIDEVLKREEKKNVEREKNRLPTGVLTYIKKTSGVKKGVQWKPDEQLESVRYFELDETERVNVTKAFSDMKQMERTNERLHLQRKLTADDIMEEKTIWRPLIPVDITGEIVIPGKNSLEKEIQQARERTTLQAIYFDKSMIPDSPSEPDLEIHSTTEPTIIPLDDQTGNPDSVISYKNKPWPEPKGYEPGVKSNESPPQMFPDVPPMLQQPPPMMGNPQFGPGPGPYPPFIPGQGMMPGQEWMVNGENMMNDNNMMMMGMNPGMPGMNPNMPMNMPPNIMPPGMMGPPEMFQGPPDMMPQFFGPNPGMFGPRPPGPFQGNNGPPMQDNMRNPRPWFNKQNGGPPGGGGSWRHPNKNNMKGGNNWKNKGICNNFSRKGFCRVPNCQYKHIKPNKNR